MARQYCGQFDGQDNCQVAVSLSLLLNWIVLLLFIDSIFRGHDIHQLPE